MPSVKKLAVILLLLPFSGHDALASGKYISVHNRAVNAYRQMNKSRVGWEIIGYSGNKNCIYCREFGSGKKTVLIIGGLHGDEPGSTLAVIKFGELLNWSPELVQGHVVLIPCINPDGLINNTRVNGSKVDLNRNFPTITWTEEYVKEYNFPGKYPASEPETIVMINAISDYNPWMIIQVHQPFNALYPSGDVPEEYYRDIADKCGLEVKLEIGYQTPGSLGSYLDSESLKIPSITMELGSIYSEPDYSSVNRALLKAVNYRPDE